jgi:hypothetical protein
MRNASTKRWLPWWIAGYAALIAAVAGSMLWARQSVLSGLATPESISDWQSWRSDVKQKQADSGQAERRIPKSDQPPALILMREYFSVLMTGAILFMSLLYWITAWFITGIVTNQNLKP